VAASPASVKKLIKRGFSVVIESGAGTAARFSDAEYEAAGAELDPTGDAAWGADVVLKVRAPQLGEDSSELERLREGALLVSLVFPAQNQALLEALAARNISCLALDQVPRISRAQKMDVLSSMANIAGYRAVIEAAQHYGGFFAGQMTAAGRTPPAQVLVIGAGVAGLAAIAAARGLGAEVRAFDVRPSVKDQVESLGARFLMLDFSESGETSGGYAKTMSKEFIDAEMALFRKQAPDVDIVVTTALIPGKPAPKLWTAEMVQAMKAGSVVVDLAAEQGGNCDATQADEIVEVDGVTVVGLTDLTSRLATHASTFYANNLVHLLNDIGNAELELDLDDVVVRRALVAHEGQVTWPPPPDAEVSVSKAPTTTEVAPPPKAAEVAKGKRRLSTYAQAGVAAAVLAFIGTYAPPEFVTHFTVFVLACFIGWQVIWNVSPALHTPLMSVTNAISGIIIVGGLLQASSGGVTTASVLGAIAVLVASINIVGGFLVTQRMLSMFKKEG
jgi:NAD(P) transhydrogenase subunit alpha